MNLGEMSCVDCKAQGCAKGDEERPAFCPGEKIDGNLIEASLSLYEDDPAAFAIMQAAFRVNTEGFTKRWCRVEETIEFFRGMGWERIGIASCAGLLDEAHTFAQILRAKGFEPYGICCKVGSVPRSRFDAPESCCDYGTISCNPIMQAKLLNEEGTQANVIIGLCVGHDMLFNVHSSAPVTTLVAKDRAMYHNPVGALHAAKGPTYYNQLLKPDAASEA